MLNCNFKKKKHKSERIIILLFFSINLILLSLILPKNHYKIGESNDQNDKESLNPISSQSEIDIITPENITYSAPMSGYYPATYGFENDKIGDIPYEWIMVQSPTLTNAYVIDEKDNHKKVLLINDYNSTSPEGYIRIGNNFGHQSSGTIEYWIRITNASQYFLINIRYEGYTMILLYLSEGKWKCCDGGEDVVLVPNMTDPVNNRWHHIKIDFECSFGEYEDLYQHRWKVNIDGRDSGPLAFFMGREYDYLNYVELSTGAKNYKYDVYIDAVGYSWDENYQIGDNFNEGLYLSFTNSTVLEWMGYSLDNQLNRTIYGNTTISIPEDGIHTIQLFANNSIGEYFTSDIRYFTIDTTPPIITINSPDHYDFFGTKSPNFNISIEEMLLNTTWYTINDGDVKYLFSNLVGKINQTGWDQLSNGTVSITFYANDSGGLIGFEQVIVRKDILAPIIELTEPRPYDQFGADSPTYNLDILDGNLNEIWYSLDGGQTNITSINPSGKINQIEWNKINNGTVSITFYANDTMGLISTEMVIVRKDIIAPIINVTEPVLYEVFGADPPSFTLQVFDGNLDALWYSLDEGQTNITFTALSGTINDSLWKDLPEGEVVIRFYARDTLQNENYKEIIVIKDLPHKNGSFIFWTITILSIVGVAIVVPVMIWILRKNKNGKFF
ncbi:MAG: hypothetical protein ACFFDH_04870 [Promethearchaeota archaeon]